MLYSRFVARLVHGELKNLNVVDNVTHSLKDEYAYMILEHTNQGLSNLFTRFVLSTKQVMLRINLPITIYHLRGEYARTNEVSEVPYKYIDDTVYEPFLDDVIGILAVFGENGTDLSMNDESDPNSVFITEYDTLQITNGYEGDNYTVVYQANHAELTLDDETQSIRLPHMLMEALQSYVAGKVLSHMNGQEHGAKGQEYMMRYDQLCSEAEMKNIISNSGVMNYSLKLKDRGFI